MSLVPVKSSELSIGAPLPWPLYDKEHNLLKAQGESIDTKEQLQSILDTAPLRELSWQSASVSSRKTIDETPEIDLSDAPQERFTFYDMNLKVGDRIQLQPPAQLGPRRHIVKLVGYVDPVSVLVSAPMAQGVCVPLAENEDVIARVFSGQNAFAFTCTIKRVCRLPFAYIHLSFPGEIQGAVIRKSPRIRIGIIGSIAATEDTAGDALPCKIANISASGALVDARKPVGKAGQEMKLSFRVNLHNMDVYLTTCAIIRSVFEDDPFDLAGDSSVVHHGVEFRDLQPNDSMILQSLVYQKMIEQPHTVI